MPTRTKSKATPKVKVVKKADKPDDEVIAVEPMVEDVEPVDEPAPDVSEMDIAQIAGIAWDKVKADDDAPFALAQPNFRNDLIYHAEAVQRSGRALSDDSTIGAFEREVRDMLTGG